MTYSVNVSNTIQQERKKVMVNSNVTKAKAQRFNRLEKYLTMANPVSNTVTVDETVVSYDVFNIDALRDDCGWSWNDKFKMDSFDMDVNDDTLSNSRKLLKLCRDNGWLTEQSKGKVKVDFVNGDNEMVEILNKNTYEPLIAIVAKY